MSRKNKSFAKKQKRRDRKSKRNLRRMEHAVKRSGYKNLDEGTLEKDLHQFGSLIDQGPSTSRRCTQQQSSPKRSPWKSAGGKVNRFKKIADDQARRLVKRTVYLANDRQTLRKLISTKISSPKKDSSRLLNKRKENILKRKIKNKDRASNTLEEGEIRSDDDKSCASTTSDTIKNDDSNEDDCMLVEPTLEEITIDDDDDDDDNNIPSTSDISTHYQSLVNSVRKHVSSTPYRNRKSPLSQAANVNAPNNDNVDKCTANDILPFFVDVGPSCSTESINSTDNFTNYIKLSTLTEKSVPKRRSVRLKQISDGPEVIDVDDISNSNENTNSTLKLKSWDMCDDSVIFVSETNKNDFIPIADALSPKQLKIREATCKTPANKLRTNNLFTHSETKKLNEYNDNAYNPSAEEELTAIKRMVIIDGSNVAFKHGLDQTFSVKGLKIAIEYFEKLGHEVKAIIPQFRMNRTKSTNPEELERLHKAGKIVQTPCKNLPGHTSISYDDRFILQLAFTTDAAIVSNDNYRDLLHENPAFKKIVENRVIGYTWCNDIFILPKDPYGRWGPTLDTILNRR